MGYSNTIIEDLLTGFRPVLGTDYNKYRNHVYRVFLNCILIDRLEANAEKYAIAAVFHDIGIWTDQTFDYLQPSIRQAEIYLTRINKAAWLDEISLMINWHHKISKYKGMHTETVENFRKADWIDVSLGLLSFDLDRKSINETRKKFPNAGFHLFLIKETVKNFFRHPLNPLPIFKK
ncbi:MAG: HD domain-containing protein [Ferruginibacter sp.]